MADLNHSKSKKKGYLGDPDFMLEPDMDWEMDDEDELYFADDDEIDEEILELSADEDIPSWRRIEMAREDRFLKEAMADFEDYDAFEDYGRDYSAGFSH